jgi:hypothetical protein
LVAPIGKVWRIRSANKEFHRFLFFFHCASPICGVKIAGPIVLAQQKGYERVDKAWTSIRRTSPFVTEIAC